MRCHRCRGLMIMDPYIDMESSGGPLSFTSVALYGAPRLDSHGPSSVFGETRRSMSSFAKASEDTRYAFPHASLLPIGLSRAGIDPALASGPVATVVQDILSVSVYLGIASLIL